MKTVLALIGPKGSGKTYLGRMLEERLDVGFVDVEAVFRAMSDPGKVAEGYAAVESQVSERLATHAVVSLELTGAAPETGDLLDRLAEVARVRLIRVQAPLALCLERISRRDATVQLPTTEELVRRVHAISCSLDLPFDLTVRSGQESAASLTRRVAALLGRSELDERP